MRKLDRKTNCLPSMDSITQRHTQIASISPKQEGWGLMQSEEAYTADLSKVTECVDSEETALIQTDRTYRAVQTEQCYRQLEA
jgi:hypothetical protein